MGGNLVIMTATPQGRPEAILEVFDILTGPVPETGQRHESLLNLAYRAAEGGFSNDMVLQILSAAADAWGKYPGRYERWSKLMNMLRRVRAEFPNSEDGSGWKAP